MSLTPVGDVAEQRDATHQPRLHRLVVTSSKTAQNIIISLVVVVISVVQRLTASSVRCAPPRLITPASCPLVFLSTPVSFPSVS